MLVVVSSEDYDDGLEDQLIILRGLGFREHQLTIVFAKADVLTVPFENRKSVVLAVFSKVGYKAGKSFRLVDRVDSIPVIPVSATRNMNIACIEPGSWYSGPSLKQHIDEMKPSERSKDKPLRISVLDVFKIGGVGTVVAGVIKSGYVQPGEQVHIEPGNIRTEVKSVEIFHEQVAAGIAGDCVGINVKGISVSQISKGSVVFNHARVATVTEMTVMLLMVGSSKLRVKSTGALFCHTARTTYE